MKKQLHNGWQKLACAVITQAVEDLNSLRMSGWIVGGRVMVPETEAVTRVDGSRMYRRRKCVGFTQPAEVAELMEFFKPGGEMDDLLREAHLDINPNQVRRRLCIHAQPV